MTLKTASGTYGALALSGFILTLVGAALGGWSALELLTFDPLDRFLAEVLVLGGLTAIGAVGAWQMWEEKIDTGGVIAIIAAVGFLVFQPPAAGYLCLIGGILVLVSQRVTRATP